MFEYNIDNLHLLVTRHEAIIDHNTRIPQHMKGTFLPRLPLSHLEIATTPRLSASLPQPSCLLAPLLTANVTVLTLALGLMNVATPL